MTAASSSSSIPVNCNSSLEPPAEFPPPMAPSLVLSVIAIRRQMRARNTRTSGTCVWSWSWRKKQIFMANAMSRYKATVNWWKPGSENKDRTVVLQVWNKKTWNEPGCREKDAILASCFLRQSIPVKLRVRTKIIILDIWIRNAKTIQICSAQNRYIAHANAERLSMPTLAACNSSTRNKAVLKVTHRGPDKNNNDQSQ